MWLASDQFKAIRLLGKQPLDAVDDPDVLQILVAGSGLLNGDTSGKTFAPLASELNWLNNEREDYLAKLVHRQLWITGASDADSAHQVLRNIVNRETSRLKSVLARNERYDLADTAEAPSRLAFDPSSEGEKLRRYVLSAGRLVNQTIRTYLSVARCPLSVDREGLSDLPGASCEVPAESSLVPGPLSVVAEEDQAESSLVSGPLSVVAEEGRAESSLVPGPLPVVAEEGQIAGEASALGEVVPSAPTEATAESSLVPGPLSVVAEEGQIAGEVSALGEVAPSAPTEPTAESSLVPGPLSVVAEEGRIAGEASSSWRGCSKRADRTHGGGWRAKRQRQANRSERPTGSGSDSDADSDTANRTHAGSLPGAQSERRTPGDDPRTGGNIQASASPGTGPGDDRKRTVTLQTSSRPGTSTQRDEG